MLRFRDNLSPIQPCSFVIASVNGCSCFEISHFYVNNINKIGINHIFISTNSILEELINEEGARRVLCSLFTREKLSQRFASCWNHSNAERHTSRWYRSIDDNSLIAPNLTPRNLDSSQIGHLYFCVRAFSQL